MWKYSNLQLMDVYRKLIDDEPNVIINKVLIKAFDIAKEVIIQYFEAMNQYAFTELKTMIREEVEINGYDEDCPCDFSVDAMKERIILLEKEYAALNNLLDFGICPDNQIQYLAKKTSDWYRENYNYHY